MKTFENKTAVPLTKDIVRQHLAGTMAVGVYPLLSDNTSWFLAADFDGDHWLDDVRSFIEAFAHVGLTAYLERSKSGAGGHVWIFFSENHPAYKSRRLGPEIVRRAFNLSVFDKEVSFDRLFPNQDTMPKGGFGNLIALPLNGRYARQHNTMFIDPTTAESYPDQWGFLATVRRHTVAELDAALVTLDQNLASLGISKERHTPDDELIIHIGKQIRVPRTQLNPTTISFLREKLNFINTEYLSKKRLGISIWQVQKYFKLIGEIGDDILLPRGFANQLIAFLKSNETPFRIQHEHPDIASASFNSLIHLTPSQEAAVQKALLYDQGVIVAPPGSGKTMIGMEIIARRQLPALILVHRKQLLDQWVDRIQTYLDIPKIKVGRFSGVTKKFGQQITVGLLQSLARQKDLSALAESFGTVIVDECHHIPAKTFREVVANLNPQYLYGLTATPKRKHNDEQLIFVYIGDIIVTMEATSSSDENSDVKSAPSPGIIVRETALQIPFQWKTDRFQLLAKIISFDTARNQLIADDIIRQTTDGNNVLVLSERKEHLEILALCLKGHCEIIVITGDDSAGQRASKLKQIHYGHYQVILSTGQFFGEGLDIKNISTLILAFPFSFEGKLAQYIGRLLHSAHPKFVIDYRDRGVAFLERQYKQRQRYYNKLSQLFGAK